MTALSTAQTVRVLSHTACITFVLLAFANTAAAVRCVKCPNGYFPHGHSCFKKSVDCGPLHVNRRDGCYKKHANPRMGPLVTCRRGHDKFVSKCLLPCRRGFYKSLDVCISKADETQVYMRDTAAPMREWCPKGYWMENSWCRKGCPRDYKWIGSICRVASCPPGTTDIGSACRKPTAPCVRVA